jgi:signal transduction histidine kinase
MDAVRTLLPLRQVLATRDAVAQVTLRTTRFRALVTLQSDIYWQTDPVGRLVTCSRPLPGGHWTFLGRTLRELLAPGCGPDMLSALEAALQTGQVFRRLRISGRRVSDNSRFDLLFNGEPLLDDAGRFDGWHGTIVDVTREMQMHAALRQKEAVETDKLRSVALLAAGIAHDFNNLLGSINGLAELCELDATEGSHQARNLGRIRQAGDRAALLVRQMLDFSRQTPMTPQRLLASVWLAHADVLLRAALPRHIAFSVAMADDGPVNIDLVQMDQVLLNLTRNAAHAIREPGGAVRIVVDRADPAIETSPVADAATATPQHLRLRVIDNGAGMSAEVIAQIFNPFFTTKPVGQGTGLGLAAVHGIVGSHGGSVEADSEVGIGTTFSLFLPLADLP